MVRRISRALLFALCLPALSTSAVASDGAISRLDPILETDFQVAGCEPPPPMYEPGLYSINSGGLGMITQGNCLGTCDPGMGDSLFRWQRFSNGSWTKPTSSTGAMPGFKENVNVAPISGTFCNSTNQLTSFTGAFGSPAIVRIGSRLIMAYLKGNGDWWAGEIWLAVSYDNGATWTKQTQALIYAPAHRGHQTSHDCLEAFSGLSATTTADAAGTWIHIYGTYFHPNRELPGGSLSFVHYRIKYDSNNQFGVGSPKQLLVNGQWVTHSGKIVWTHDSIAPQPGESKLGPAAVQASWGRGAYIFPQSVTRGPGGVYYMLIDKWRNIGDPLTVRTSCDAVNWTSTPLVIDTSMVNSAHPGKWIMNNALYYGTLGSETGFWGFLSLGPNCPNTTNPYAGTRILPVKITMTTTPGCP